MRKIKYSFLSIAFFWQCSPDYLLLKVDSLSDSKWTQTDIKTYEFEVTPEDKLLELSLVLENNEDFPYNNIYLFTELSYPSGKIEKDTLQYQMTTNSGYWLGTGIGGSYTNLLLMKDSMEVQDLGIYQMRIIHGMRAKKLEGVSKVGLRVLTKN